MNAVYYKDSEVLDSFSDVVIDVNCLESTTNQVYSTVTDAIYIEEETSQETESEVETEAETESETVVGTESEESTEIESEERIEEVEDTIEEVSGYSENFVYSVEYDEEQALYLLEKLDTEGNITTIDTLSGNTKLYVNDGILYYTNNGELYDYDGTATTNVLSGVVTNIEDFIVVSNEAQKYVVFKVSNGYQSELYKTWDLLNAEAVQSIEQITDYEKYIRTFDAVLNENGNVEAVINYCDIVQTDNDANYENSQLIVSECTNVIKDISVDYLYYDSDDVQTSESLPLSFKITNNSQSVLNEFQAELTDEEGNILIQETYTCEVADGASEEFTLDYIMTEGKRLKTALHKPINGYYYPFHMNMLLNLNFL